MAVKRTAAGTWETRFRGPDGRERSKTLPTKLLAQRWEREHRSDIGRGVFAELPRDRTTVAEWAPLWLAGIVHVTPKTKDRYAGIVKAHIIPTWGPRRLDSISHAELQAWVVTLGEQDQEPASVRKIVGVLSRIFDLAITDKGLTSNPARKLKLPRVPQSRHRYLTHLQVEKLASQMNRRDALVTYVLSYCGLRWGELAALRIEDVDFLRRRIDVHRSVTVVNGAIVWGEPKDHERRSVPVPAFLIEDLAPYCAGRPREELLFSTKAGDILRAQNFHRVALSPAASSMGLDGLHPHELRHTAASLAISAGANVKAVQTMLGHASAAMTLDVYTELFPDDLDRVSEALDAARANSLAGNSRALAPPRPLLEPVATL
jgi:integrase